MSNPHGGRISDHMYPFYRVFDEKGEQYCDCSHEKYAIKTVELHEEYQNEKSMRVSYQVNKDFLVLTS